MKNLYKFLFQQQFYPPVRTLFFLFLLVVLGHLLYFNALYTDFQYDDERFLTTISESPSVFDPVFYQQWQFRSITALTFKANETFFESDIVTLHYVNLLIHIVNSILVFGLCCTVCEVLKEKTRGIPRSYLTLSFFAAAIFLVHPLQTQAVTYITQRLASLTTLFYVASVYSYISFRRKVDIDRSVSSQIIWFVQAIIYGLLALLSKETGSSLPFMLLFVELLLFSDVFNSWKKATTYLVQEKYKLVFFLGMIAYVIQLNQHRIEYYLSIVKENTYAETYTGIEYWYTQQVVLVQYLRLAIFPVGQSLEHYVPVATVFFETRVMVSFLLLSFLAYIAFYFRKKQPLISFSIGWFFIAHMVESSFFPLEDVMVEHRMYLPMVGISILFTWIVYVALQGRLLLFSCILTVIICVYGYATIERNKVWFSPLRMWEDVLQKNPKSARAHQNLAVYYTRQSAFELVEAHYKAAVEMYPTLAYSRVLLAQFYEAVEEISLAKEQACLASEFDSDNQNYYEYCKYLTQMMEENT